MWQAQIWVKWNKNVSVSNDWSWMKEWKEVQGVWSMMGDWDMMLTIDAKTPAEVEEFIWKKLRTKDWVANTHCTWAKQVWSNPNFTWKQSA